MQCRSLLPIQICQQGLSEFAQMTSKTDSLERCLRIFYKTIKLCQEFRQFLGQSKILQLDRCSIQIIDCVETLGIVQGIHLVQEFVCPDKQGKYLIQRASLPKWMGRIFLCGYNCLLNLKLAEKLAFIHLSAMHRIAIGRCSFLLLTNNSFYLLYRLCAMSEAIRAKRFWQVAVSIAKIFITTSKLILKIFNTQAPLFSLSLTCLSLLTDLIHLYRARFSFVDLNLLRLCQIDPHPQLARN